jgi:hypothetical protein
MMRLALFVWVALLLAPAVTGAEPATPAEYRKQAYLKELDHAIGLLEKDLDKLKKERKEAADAPVERRRGLGDKIVNGEETTDYASTGAVLRGSDAASAQSWCTGTLIGCGTFLTAQHCTRDDHAKVDPAELFVYLQNGGIFPVASITRHEDYVFPRNDIAILHLDGDVQGIAPSPINEASVADDTVGEIVGFGRTGGFRFDYGIKRRGTVETAACQQSLPANMLCWNFSAPVGPAGEDSNTCNADSGGPLFVTALDGVLRVAGVTSGGRQSQCLAGDHSYDVDVQAYADWIRTAAGDDLGTEACGGRDLAGDGVVIDPTSGELDAGTTSVDVTPIEIPAGAGSILVAMNGEDDGHGSSDFDLLVRQGAPPSDDEADCVQDGSGQFAVCEIEPSGPGTLFVRVQRKQGDGLFQVVTNIFPEQE